MTTTPTVWKAEFSAATVVEGFQFNPVTIGLAGGRFLTAWTDPSDIVDDDLGLDIAGQLHDAQGNPIGSAFQLNLENFLDYEDFPSLAALPDGGFVVAYQDRGSGPGGDAAIRFERYDAAGTFVADGTIAVGTLGGVLNSFPSVAALPNGDFVVSYQQTAAGDTDVLAVVVNGVTNVAGGAFAVGQNGPDVDALPDTAVLSNGRIVTVYQKDGFTSGLAGVEFRITSVAGVNLNTDEIAAAGGFPQVAALKGGGFVTVWGDSTSNSDVRAEIRDNNGLVVKSDFLVQGGANYENFPDVVALKDGGFFVLWNDETADLLRGQRFSANGTPIGTKLTIATGDVAEAELGLTGDGRILVTFDREERVSQVILDPRDNVINGDGTSEIITSRIDGATVNGNGGNDTLLGQGAADKLFGGIGNDTLTGGAGTDTLDGGDGADHMAGGADSDTYVVANVGDIVDETGGNGNELVKSSVNFNLASAHALGAIERLTLGGTATTGMGNALDNVITGNDVHNILGGGDGNDTLVSGFGNDTLSGNAGADTLKGQDGRDTLTGGLGNDKFVFDRAPIAANADTITDFANVVGSNNDFFQLEKFVVFDALGAPGAMNAAFFFAGAAAHDADDHIVYNQRSGQLLYDTNGNATGGVSLIATLANKPTLTAADFVVI